MVACFCSCCFLESLFFRSIAFCLSCCLLDSFFFFTAWRPRLVFRLLRSCLAHFVMMEPAYCSLAEYCVLLAASVSLCFLFHYLLIFLLRLVLSL